MESARKILQFARPGTVIEFSLGSEKEISLTKLVNRLNFINFQEDSILLNFRHAKYQRTVSLEARPLPCSSHKLECNWTVSHDLQPSIASCTFENIFIVDGNKLVIAEPELISIGETGAVFLLPEKCIEVNYRKTRRHPCEGVKVELLQNSARLQGTLLDFSAVSFRVETEKSSRQAFLWVNTEVPIQVAFTKGDATIYSGPCRITSQTLGPRSRIYLLEPTESRISRFKSREVRSARHELLPLPNAVFRHPLSGKSTDLKVVDISGTGFSVHEDLELSVFLPGMIIPEMELRIGNGFSTKCMVQVIYRQEVQSGDDVRLAKCGLAFLDMDIREHVNLLGLLYLANDKNSYLNNRANTDDLWQFFFETGFIYPEKYAFVQANKARLKEMYEKLYTENPSIARHCIYQERGTILGHMAMLRFYENSWLIHHHAANKSESSTAGLIVLNQLAHSINDCYHLHSAHMHYCLCYYRPENKFPNRVFGTAAKLINDPKGCSIDTFAYLHYKRNFSENWNFAGPWQLVRTTAEDLVELESFYEQESGGLMLHALNLEPEMLDCQDLSREYEKIGFTLKRYCYTLKKNGEIKAILTVNLSDAGLNLSDLTNCIQVVILDPEMFPKDIVYLTLSILTHKYQQDEIPVLVYPVSYVEGADIPYDKKYSLWCLNIQECGTKFMKYMATLVNRNKGNKK